MHLSNALAVGFAISSSWQKLLSAQNTSTSNAAPVIDIDQYPQGALNATAWSLVYTYPLGVFAGWIGAVLRNVPVNEIYHQRQLAGPEATGILNPNVDTTYSRVVLDLSKQDVILTVPQIESTRYFVYPVYDPYGNVVAEIGSANNNTAGKYLIRRAADVYAAPGYVEADDTLKSLGYQGIVNSPSSYGTMLIRLLVVHNTTEDLNRIHQIQNASKLENITRSEEVNSRNPTPDLTSLAFNGSFLGISTLAQQLQFAARIVPYSQSYVYEDRFRVASILSAAGVYAGAYNQPSGLNLTQAGVIANTSYNAAIKQPQALVQRGNDWQLQAPSYQGNYGTHYASAASVAIGGYQQQKQVQALYPQFQGRGFSTYITLEANKSLLFTWSAKPKLKQTGFWSLSAYGTNGYLIPNSLSRYEAGDRTYNITYQNGGGHVYGPEADGEKDGPFQILLQRNTTAPPANWTGNWLPVTDEFLILLRFYVPEPTMINGSYVYPKVENVTAIQ